jgi:hypothetical protein
MVKNITNSFRSILVILLFFLSLPMMGVNEVTSKYQVDDLYYTLYDDGTAIVEGYVENSTEVEIPATVVYKDKEYSVTSIGEKTFYNCTSLTSIQIPNSVTSIGDHAFAYCTSLTSIQIPNSVTSIGGWAFYKCTSLTSIQIPNSVTSIGNFAFSGCTSLTSIQIPNSVTSIGNFAFSGCTSLTSIQIPNSVTSIGGWAFYKCTSLTSIQIPNSVTSIGNRAFYQCTSLTKIICDAIAPPTAKYESTFDTDTYTNCQLLVPEESIDSYKNSQYVWSKFANISANPEYVDIDSPEASYSATSHPTIYNLNGTAISGDTQSLSPGIYIIKEGSKSRKIIVK